MVVWCTIFADDFGRALYTSPGGYYIMDRTPILLGLAIPSVTQRPMAFAALGSQVVPRHGEDDLRSGICACKQSQELIRPRWARSRPTQPGPGRGVCVMRREAGTCLRNLAHVQQQKLCNDSRGKSKKDRLPDPSGWGSNGRAPDKPLAGKATCTITGGPDISKLTDFRHQRRGHTNLSQVSEYIVYLFSHKDRYQV